MNFHTTRLHHHKITNISTMRHADEKELPNQLLESDYRHYFADNISI